MAGNNIKGITIEIGGNTSPLEKALQGVNKTSRDLETELKQVEKLLKLDPTNTELLAQKQKLLTESVENTSTKLNTLKEAEIQVQQQFKEGKVSEEQYRALQREVITTEQKLENLESQAKKTNTVLSEDDAVKNLKNIGIAAGVAAAAAGAALVGLAGKAMESADELQKQADVTGLTAERLQELKYAGNNLGVELETLIGAQAKLTKTMEAAETGKNGPNAQAEAFNKLGINVRDSSGNLRDAKTVMMEAFDALGNIGNETERDSLSMQIFGKSAMAMNPIIKAGSEELKKLTDEAHKNGAVMSNEAIAGLDTFGDTIDNIKSSILGAFGEKLAQLMPKIQDFLDKLIELPQWIDKNKTMLQIIGIAIGTLTVAIIAYNVVAAWGAITTGVLTAATTAFGAVLAFITSPITLVILAIGALIAIGVLLYKNWDTVKEACSKAWDSITSKISEVVDKIINFFKELPGKAKKELDAIITKFGEWKNALLEWIGIHLRKIINDIVHFFIELPGKVWEAINGVIDKLVDLKNDMVNWVKDKLPEFTSKFIEAMKELPKKMLDIGKNIVMGIWDGIVVMKDWLMDKVKGFTSGIVDGIKSALKIQSPSQVLADEVGKYMAQGIGVGFEKEMSNVSEYIGEGIKNSVMAVNSTMGGLDNQFNVKSMGIMANKNSDAQYERQPSPSLTYNQTVSAVEEGMINALKVLPDQSITVEMDGVKVARQLMPKIQNEKQRLGVALT